MNTRKFRTLFKKDIRQTLSNKNIILLLMLPLIFAVLYKYILPLGEVSEHGPLMILVLVTVLGLSVVSSSLVGMSIAEEKEKKTLRTLMLSGVSGVEFVSSKMLVILTFFSCTMLIGYIILGQPIEGLWRYMIDIILTTIPLLFISATIGLYAKNVQSVGIVGVPFMFITMIPMFTTFTDNKVLILLAKFVPSGPMIMMMVEPMLPGHGYALWMAYLTLIGWTVISLLIFTLVYQKRKLDN